MHIEKTYLYFKTAYIYYYAHTNANASEIKATLTLGK